MTIRWYLAPTKGTGEPPGVGGGPYRPKYFDELDPKPSRVSNMRFFGHFRLVVADVSIANHNELVTYTDVVAIPLDIDGNLNAAAVTKVRNYLEARNFPNAWINESYTYRQVMRLVCQVMQFTQAYFGNGKGIRNLFDNAGVTPDTEYRDLHPDVQDRLQSTAAKLGYDTSGLTASSTIKQILKQMGDEWTGPILLGDEVL